MVARFRTDSFGSGEERASDAVSLLQHRVASAPNVTLLGAFSRAGPAAPVAAGAWGFPCTWIGLPAFSDGAGEGESGEQAALRTQRSCRRFTVDAARLAHGGFLRHALPVCSTEHQERSQFRRPP